MKMNTNWQDLLRQQKHRDGWCGEIGVPRWYLYGTLALILYHVIKVVW